MPVFSTYTTLPFADQMLHGLHFMLCTFAVLIGCVPLLTEKGSVEHKFFGLIYIPVSFVALIFSSIMAWRENSMVLFCFTCFCTYLLLSGWRAVHENDKPNLIDYGIAGSLFILSVGVTCFAIASDDGLRSFYLMFFAINAFYLSWRDAQHVRERIYWSQRKIFFADHYFGTLRSGGWAGRHIAGMVGSMLANVSVIILTLLPLSLHWLWPVVLLLAGGAIAQKERRKKMRVNAVLPPAFRTTARAKQAKQDDPIIRRAA